MAIVQYACRRGLPTGGRDEVRNGDRIRRLVSGSDVAARTKRVDEHELFGDRARVVVLMSVNT